MRVDPERYLNHKKIYHPSSAVTKIAGRAIRKRAQKYFQGKMLEVGCGTKRKHMLIGDLIDEHIGLERKDCPHDHSNIDIFGSAYDIPADDDTFDCILSTAVMEHLEEPQLAVNEGLRVLKPGGYALYTMPLFWHLHEEPRDFYRYTKHGLHYIYKKAGFKIVEISPLSGFITTFFTELNYYLLTFNRSVLKPLISVLIGLNNILIPYLDQGFLRNEKFTWMYIVVVQKPMLI